MSAKKDVENKTFGEPLKVGSVFDTLNKAIDNIDKRNRSAKKAADEYDKQNGKNKAVRPVKAGDNSSEGRVKGKGRKGSKAAYDASELIQVYEAATGCELDAFGSINQCLAGMKESYNVDIQPSLLIRNLEGLSRSCKGYIFKYGDTHTSVYSQRTFGFISVRTGEILEMGDVYALSKLARVTPQHILTKAKLNESDKPELFQSLPVLCMELFDNGQAEDIDRAQVLWKRYLEYTMRMFPTVLDSQGRPLVSFFSIAEACKAIRAVSVTEAVAIKKIRDACYNETTYFGYDWCFKPGYVYCEHAYISDEPDEMAIFETATAGETPESFSVSSSMLRTAKGSKRR